MKKLIRIYVVLISIFLSSQTLKGQDTCYCPEDVNHDGMINGTDYLLVLGMMDSICNGCPEDINKDGIVDGSDYLMLLGRMNSSCECQQVVTFDYDGSGNRKSQVSNIQYVYTPL